MLKENQQKCTFSFSLAGVNFTLRTHQIDFYSYMCLQGGTTAIHKISNKTIEHF